MEQLGRTRVEDVAGRRWSQLCQEPGAAERLEQWEAQVTHDRQPVLDAELALGSGQDRRLMLVSMVPLTPGAEPSRDARVLGLCADVTDQRALERRVAASSRLESIGRLAAGIAHEINTPMQHVGNNGAFLDKAFGLIDGLIRDLLELAATQGIEPARIEALTSGAKLDLLRARIPRATSQVTEGVEAMARTVRSLKTFAHPGSDEFEPVDLRQALDSTVTISRNEWRHVAELLLDVASDLPPVRAVPGTMNQVLLNLVVNAAHAIDERRSGPDDDLGRITIRSRACDGYVETRVKDNGCGIPDSIRAKVYDLFFTTKPAGKGTGQGLAICRDIVTRHGGDIGFATSPAGTTFSIRIPVWERAAVGAAN
jgi:signal transduction histidine kinase